MGATESKLPVPSPTLDYVEQVAGSRAFGGSASLPRLLRYLAERAVAEPGQTIKEFRIATEALGRGPGFDTRTDSVVRVTTARLRSKLEEYYADEGAQDPIRLRIPKGSYKLLAIPAEATAESVDETIHDSAPARPAKILLAATLVAFGVGYLFGARSAPPGRAALDTELSRFWGAFAHTPRGVRVVYSNVPHDVTSDGRVLAGRRRDPDIEPDDRHTGVGEVQAIYRLAGLASRLELDLQLKRAQLVDWDEVVDVHVIYLGGPAENPQVADLGAQANFVFELEPLEHGGKYVIRNRSPLQDEAAIYSATPPLTEDYGIVRLTRGFRSDRWMLLLAGITTFGTSAAADVVADPSSLRQIRESLGQSLADPLQPFECVVKVGLKNSVPFESRIKACRSLVSQ